MCSAERTNEVEFLDVERAAQFIAELVRLGIAFSAIERNKRLVVTVWINPV